MDLIREGWAIDLSSESSYSVSFPMGAKVSACQHARPYSHLSGLVEEPNMTIHDLASGGQPCLLKQSAVITNMKDGLETADTHGIAVRK